MHNGTAVTGQPRPFRPRLRPRLAYAANRLAKPNRFYRRLAIAIERHPRAERWFTVGERVAKEAVFACRMCGQCALPATGYACPMSCPKQLRNGPCGGVSADVGPFTRWMAEVRELGIIQRCKVIVGVGPVRSLRALEFMRTRVPGIHVPDQVRRLRGGPGNRVAREGVDLCVETIQQLMEIPRVAGVHVMALGYERGVPGIIERVGIGPRYASSADAEHGHGPLTSVGARRGEQSC